MIWDRRGVGDTGPLQALFISLLLISAAGFAMFSYYDGLITNYDTPELANESAFTVYQDFSANTTNEINEIRDTIQDRNGTGGAGDIILEITTRGFSVLTDIIAGPLVVANSILNAAFEVLEIPSYLQGLAYAAILAIALFAIVALIMKVRA